jgi:acetylornithine deacetylase/succinyl-diaminopimelate desuccinylase-like protein
MRQQKSPKGIIMEVYMPENRETLYQRPAELLQRLIRFDTTNPPGNERECIRFIAGLLEEAGIATTLIARTPERPNLVARLKGEGNAPPLLLYGHVDVVTTSGQNWQHPPFEAHLVDGYVWGRGALDMKGGVAMLLAAFLKARMEGAQLPGEVIFAAVADEEAGGEFGARYLVEQHPGLFEGARFAFSEFGGFNLSMSGRRFYPIMIAEKQICAMRVTFRGQGGHGSIPVKGECMARLGRALQILDQRRLPVHITPAVKMMMDGISAALPGMPGLALRQITNPALTDGVLKLLGERSKLFSPLFRNTVSPTMLQASDKINVIPCEVSLGLDGRLLPGSRPDQMVAELRALLGEDFELEVVAAEAGPAGLDMGLFDMLSGVLRKLDPEGVPVPYVMPGVTDARFFSQLGIQTYGFVPLKLPEDFNFVGTVHAENERVPVAALDFGTTAIFQALQQFHQIREA